LIFCGIRKEFPQMFNTGCDGDWPLSAAEENPAPTQIQDGDELLEKMEQDPTAASLWNQMNESFEGDRDEMRTWLLSPSDYLEDTLPAVYILLEDYTRVKSALQAWDVNFNL
jgi:hypothetical protein